MNMHKVIVVLVLILFYSSATHGVERNAAEPSRSGYGFEGLLTKLDRLYDKIAELESRMQKDRENIEKKLNGFISGLHNTISQNTTKNIEGKIQTVAWYSDQRFGKLDESFDILQNKTKSITQQCEINHQKLSEVISQLSQIDQNTLSGAVHRLSYNISTLHAKSNTEMEERLTKVIQRLIERKFSEANATIDRVRQTFVEKLTTLQVEGKEALYNHILWANHEQIREEIQTVKSKEDFERLKNQKWGHLWQISLKSCKDNPSKRNGRYILHGDNKNDIFLGYCVNTISAGNWLEIQFRFDGSENFTRSWKDYRDGFGNYSGEQWIGLERLHRLTSKRPHELHVQLEDFDGNSKYARYSEFEIGSEAEHYELKKLGGYSGTAGDSLAIHKGMKFSTWDRDNDSNDGNCASLYKGGWWYKDCYDSNLNGLLKKGNDWENIVWKQFNSSDKKMGLAYSRMHISEK